jgi:branched-chain amino acid transport system substrate-binding protein
MLKKILFILMIGVLLLPAATQAQKKWVTFGVICPTSGPVALLGQSMLMGIDLVLEEVNTRWNPPEGGIMVAGQRYYVRYQHYDDEADPAKSPIGFRKLVDTYKVPFIMGPLGTPHSWGCAAISQELGVLFDGFSASDRTRRIGSPYLFQSRPPANYLAAPMAKACIDRGWKRFAVLADVSEAYTQWGKDFRTEMEKLGGSSVGFESVDTKTVTDYHSIMTKFNANRPDVIFLSAYEEPNATMAMHALDVGYKGKFLGNENFTHITINIVGAKRLVGSILDTWGMHYYRDHPEEDPTGAVPYVWKLYKQKYGDKPWHGLVGNLWDQTLHFIKAMEVAGSVTDSLAIRVALDRAASLMRNRMTCPYDGVLPEGVMTGWTDLLVEIQPDGTMKKVGELVTPTEALRIYKNPDDSPLYKLLKEKKRYDEFKKKGLIRE